jgi:hypothetical protein
VTTVSGRVLRPKLGYDSFADLTSVPVAIGGIRKDGITFTGTLTPAEITSVWSRMESADDADMAARADLRAKLATSDPDLCGALVRYVLGD